MTGSEKTFTILHTNDLHGHIRGWQGWEGGLKGQEVGGFERIASVLKRIRSERGSEKVILIDAGDAIGDTLEASLTQGRAVLNLMSQLKYDAMVLGNHEFDFGVEMLAKYAKETSFPLLSANAIDHETKAPLFSPYTVLRRNGGRIGIIGLSYPNTPLTTASENVKGVVFTDAAIAASGFVSKLRSEKVDLIVVLSHLGLSADIELAKKVSGIDLIVGGHSHNRMSEMLEVNGARIVQAGAHGSNIGRLDVGIQNGKVHDMSYRLIGLGQDVSPDPEFQALTRSASDRKDHSADTVIAHASELISRAQTLAGQDARKRDEQSDADSLFADLIRDRLKVDVVLLPGVGYGVALKKGEIRQRDLRNLIPHDSKIVIFDLAGNEIKQILEQSVENVFTGDMKTKVGGMIQVSGLNFRYDSAAPHGERVQSVNIAGQPMSPHKYYAVATNEMLANGGHGYATFKFAKKKAVSHESQFEQVRDQMRRVGRISAPSDKRIFRD